MDVNWIDLVVILLMVVGVWVGFRRGFGRAIFDFAALFIALRTTLLYSGSLARAMQLTADKQSNEAWVFGLSFLVSGVILWFLGKWAYDATLVSLDTFDPPLGAALGFAISIVVAHVFVKLLFLAANTEGAVPDVIVHSTLGLETLEFPTYHAVLDFMFRLGQ